MGATRPPMTFGLPHTLSVSLIAAGLLFFLVYDTGHQINDLIVDAVVTGALAMVWTGAKVLLRTDYHGWDNFIAWCRLDARCLDTREWDGARLASLPLTAAGRPTMLIERITDRIGPAAPLGADSSVMGAPRMPGAPFSLVVNGVRNDRKRRLTALLNAVADENVEVHIHLVKHDATLPPAQHGGASSCRSKASDHAD